MFAKHLMTVSARKPDKVYTYGNPGDYIANGTPRRLVYDTTGRIVFSKPTAGPASVRGEGRVDADGTVAMVRLNPGAGPFDPDLPSTVEIWSTDNHGPVAVSDKYTIPANLVRVLVATKARTVLGAIQSNQTQVSYRFIDLASGTTFADPVVYNPDLAVRMASREAIYLQADYTADAASADPRVFLPAGNGRAARARIVPVDHSRKRFVGRYTTGGLVDVTLTPWRRPLTTDTRCRAYSWTNGVGDAIRAGKLYRRVAIFTNEIEIGPSQGVVVNNGVRCTRHTMSIYRGSTFGLVRLTLAAGAEIIPVGAAMQSGTMTMLQYLDPGDVPTNEYIIEANGSYASVNDNLLTRSSSGHPRTPACVAMNAIVVTHTDGKRLALYDLAGNFMKLTNPPGGAIPVDWTDNGPSVPTYGIDGAYFHIQSHDLLVRADGYDKVVPASFDMGETWVNTYIPSNPSNAPPAGYTPPSNAGVSTPAPVSPPPQQGNAFLIGITGWSPLFLT